MAKKSKPSGNGYASKTKKKNKLKNNLSALNSLAMKNKAPKPNPFESMWSRRKFDILGKKQKGEERRVGLSRSIAIEKRKKTLLKEYEQSGKSSAFVDKRIGEQNEVLGEFDKAILRSQRERQLKMKKKSKYNLSDGEDELDFQGSGSFPERDDFEDELLFDEDENGEAAGSAKKSTILGQLDPHGEENDLEERLVAEENRKKSKKEVMNEIILKSKFFKAEKAKDKEENEQFIEQLDKDFASIVQSKALLSMTQPNKMKALKALVNKNISIDHAEKEGTSAVQDKFSFQQEKPDTYDKLFGEMAMDMRARPSDRTKTPEEVAQEEKERLEWLEEERQKRITGDDSSDEDIDEEASTKQQRSISGDDLGDSFSHDALPRTKLGLISEILRSENENDLESDDDDDAASEDSEDDKDNDDDEGSDDDDDDDKIQSLKDWEQNDDDNIDSYSEDGGEDEDGDIDSEDEKDDDIGICVETTNDKKPSGSKGKQKDSLGAGKVKENIKKNILEQGELPYTIEAPQSFEEFSALLDNRSGDQIVEAIRRIRTFNAISVAVENRKKMQVFYGVLLQYFAVLANKKPLNIKLLNLLVKPLLEMSSEIPYFAAICARQRLLHTRTQFCEDVKNTGKSSWPSMKILFLLRLWSMIFPCSDFRHVVMTPAILLMCEYLTRCPVMSGRDIIIGSFLCSMVLSISRQSQKFCPEAIMFIQTLLMAALDKKQGSSEDSKLYRLMEIKALRPLLCLRGQVEKINSLDFLMLMDLPDDSPHFISDTFRAGVLFANIETLKGFVKSYEGFKSFPEIFLPISKLLGELLKQDYIPDALQVQIIDVNQLIEKKAQEYHLLRQPLRMRKPKIIKTEIPKFEENFVKGRDYDPDRERAQRKKLKKLLRQEAKGAARELRKDNYFLLEVKERDKAQLSEERAEKYGQAKAFLQEQEHAFKSGQLGRSKKRRR
ncbi:nucleolar 14 [Olea europaea subsp. europaea]|uniref:Nucleolar 14 n=2 Tax=Olea europaea subsp. europaea TaxID=158383 RepID=A0A8S0PGJ9_OLEEU|nr:nucleolar 14 [Olea europaea subsp. europaea]